MSPSPRAPNRYSQIIERVFVERYHAGDEQVPFSREDLAQVADDLGIVLPKNLGDILYSFRYRTHFPEAITLTAPTDREWTIQPAGRGRYAFALVAQQAIAPSPLLAETKIPDTTPGMIARYALSDEQALLAKLRYNRLIDLFTGVVCYSLQSHLRTTVPGLGQVETDEIYVGVNRQGVHYVIPIQAKARRERLGIVQIEQDLALCAARFPELLCIPVAAQAMADDVIALFAFEASKSGIAISAEKHYRLTFPDQLTDEDLLLYRQRVDQ